MFNMRVTGRNIMKEKDLHPVVKKFLINEKKCLDARTELGHKYVGSADAFGIKSFRLKNINTTMKRAIKMIMTSKTIWANPNCARAIMNVTK